MNYLQRRKLKKQTKQLLHDARTSRRLREDIEPPAKLAAVVEAERALREARGRNDPAAMERCATDLQSAVAAIHPVRRHGFVREHLEILVVAISVAMAFRAYVLQPFKIPTGSMQPSLFGITYDVERGKDAWDVFPLNIVQWIALGASYQEVTAQIDGVISPEYRVAEEHVIIYINGRPHPIRRGMALRFELGDSVRKGQVLASGRKLLGDHLFVDKVRYNFFPPRRGDIFVFKTRSIRHSRIQPDTYYIKRMCALPGEAVKLAPPFLLVDGEPVTEPDVFSMILTNQAAGYLGYQYPKTDGLESGVRVELPDGNAVLRLAEDEVLPLGDNTQSSLDGRYFGGVHRRDIVGPAAFVYWPFTRRWGPIVDGKPQHRR